MRVRQSIPELFSTFLRFESDQVTSWIRDSRLHRSIQQHLAQTPEETADRFWVMYWHRAWIKDETRQALATGHISAYLQEACYWSVQKVVPKTQSIQFQLADLFQVAIASVPKILKACDPDERASLKTYASSAFGNVVRDWLRQKREIDLCSHWGLLLKLSRKRVIEVLQGLTPQTIEQYLTAWKCFELCYVPAKTLGMRQSNAPSAEVWSAIATQYTKATGETVSPATLERWLTDCANRAREQSFPSVGSLNAPKIGQDEGELQDDVTDSRNSLLAELIEQEEQQERLDQRSRLNQVLETAIAEFDTSVQQLLQLYYQQQLTQQQIAKQLEVQQYTVSRKLSKARETLLLKLVRWSQAINPETDPEVIKSMGLVLEEWLQKHYS
ncbi:MAG: sigma-70 family RNA polymerase sigma factor [Leptolyngbya sp. Prado105]|jgi:RNA polymerase sigma factor (sigma-70 family)|nr:sigma-70 family RNA polymerase sigma factor [Leptolyngbya sp. Prado105]